MHQEVTSPSPSSRKISLVPKTYRRTPGMHCSGRSSEFQRNSFRCQCRFLQNLTSISPVAVVAPCSLFLLLIHRAARSLGRLRASAASWPRRIAPCAAATAPAAAAREAQRGTAPSSTAQTTRSLRVAVFFPVRAAAQSPWPERHRARSLPPTGP